MVSRAPPILLGAILFVSPGIAPRLSCKVCQIRVSKCQKYAVVHAIRGVWFDDEQYGGMQLPAEGGGVYCKHRQASWQRDCGLLASVQRRVANVCSVGIENLSRSLQQHGPFTLVITRNAYGGTKAFLDDILPKHAVLVTPKDLMSEAIFAGEKVSDYALLTVNVGGRLAGVLTGSMLLRALTGEVESLWEKLFINHVIGFPAIFLEGLFAIKAKRFISITHDWTWLFKSSTPTFKTLHGIGGAERNYALQPFHSKLEMKSQNEMTAGIFRMSGAPFRSLDVVQMPDYNASLYPARPAHSMLKVGIIGAISRIKGAELIVPLSKELDLFIFGAIDGTVRGAGRVRCQGYNGIEELNTLLRRERPNVLIVPAMTPETYSYTLTLSMLTRLPIIVMRTPESYDHVAIINRVQAYRHTYYDNFTSAPAVAALAQSVRGSHFHLINPRVHVPPQWSHILAPKLYNVVLVASKIVTSANPLSYYPTRSRFTPKQRFDHCLETIASIRERVPNSFIVFIDNSDLAAASEAEGDGVDWTAELRSKADAFINDHTNKSLAYYTDVSDHKALGEALLLLQGMDWLEEQQVMAAMIFKLTARYTLNENFDFSQFRTPTNIFKRPTVGFAHDLKPTYIYTCFYKIADNHFSNFRNSLRNIITTLIYMIDGRIPTAIFDDIESRLAASLPDVQLVSSLGVTQRVSPYEVPDVHI